MMKKIICLLYVLSTSLITALATDIRTLGVKGDGVTPDTEQIQSAINRYQPVAEGNFTSPPATISPEPWS